jgi:hypothetical protein
MTIEHEMWKCMAPSSKGCINLKQFNKMPPKKKKGKGKGKEKKKDDPMAMELDDKYKKTVHEIEALKDQLAVRKELARGNGGM